MFTAAVDPFFGGIQLDYICCNRGGFFELLKLIFQLCYHKSVSVLVFEVCH